MDALPTNIDDDPLIREAINEIYSTYNAVVSVNSKATSNVS